jgi:uncharacterized protein (TIGR02466 family)
MNDYKLVTIFPTPVYIVKQEVELSTSELEYIRIEGGNPNYQKNLNKKHGHQFSHNTYIFDNTKLSSLKEFIEQNIAEYVNEVITPKNKELEFYITQSWVNVLKPGDVISDHYHGNSIISGVFYVSVAEDDAIIFYDFNARLKTRIETVPEKWHYWNGHQSSMKIENNVLLLFPSWLGHATEGNPGSNTDRISISFNVFVKGRLGETDYLNELII